MEMLDQMHDILRTLIEHQRNFSSSKRMQEVYATQEDMSYLHKGFQLDFLYFDENNLAGWMFNMSQYFEFHQTSTLMRII